MDRQQLIEKITESAGALYAVKKNFYAQNLYEFERDVLRWPDLYEPLHRRVCNFITDNINHKQILLLLPRGVFKSSLVTVGYALYNIVRDPSIRILIANDTYQMATQFLGQIKNHLQRNEELKRMFGDLSANTDSWREDRIYVAREKSYEQKDPTVWAQGIGSNVVGSHFDIAILDDVVSRDNISTKDQIEKVKNFYRDALDLIDPHKGKKRLIMVGTCWHWDDLYTWVQEDPDISRDFAVLKLPAYTGEWGKGELLFPPRLTWDVLDDLKRKQGSAHFSAQYMLNPIPEESQTFKGPFRKYEESDIRGLDLKKFITIDPAISEDKQADYSALMCIGVDAHNDWYILDIWRDRVLPKALIDQIFYWNEKWKPISVGIESVAFQKALQYFIYDEMRKRNQFIPLKELKHTEMSKEDRIKGLQPRYEIGAVFHPHHQSVPLVSHLEDELLRFPKGSHDDMADALASMLELAFPPREREERREVNRMVYPA